MCVHFLLATHNSVYYSTMTKKVLIMYCERVREMVIPPDSGSEIEFLADSFYQDFGVKKSCSSVTFQKFDKEWNRFVELNPDSEVPDRETLKAVVQVSCSATIAS